MNRTLGVLAVALLGGGCASAGHKAPKPVKEGVELQREVDAASAQVKATIEALWKVVTIQGDIEAAYEAFLAELASLDVRAQAVRDSARELTARREQYLTHWIGQASGAPNPESKAVAEARWADLKGDFIVLGSRGQTLRLTFAPLNQLLHDCARFLEGDATPSGARSLSGELETIQGQQEALDRVIADYKAQLTAVLGKMASQGPPPDREARERPGFTPHFTRMRLQ